MNIGHGRQKGANHMEVLAIGTSAVVGILTLILAIQEFRKGA
nr:MAG TPA: hypothetical protein [Caudoviricetes sp.]